MRPKKEKPLRAGSAGARQRMESLMGIVHDFLERHSLSVATTVLLVFAVLLSYGLVMW